MIATIAELLDCLPQVGTVRWIGVRPAKRAPLEIVDTVVAETASGLLGDRYSGTSGNRQVTLIQHEHVVGLATLVGREIEPAELRRNIVVSGINLLALKKRQFRIGEATLETTGLCHPCSRMEEALGAGGYNAMRGHGGITARVVVGGTIAVGDEVAAL